MAAQEPAYYRPYAASDSDLSDADLDSVGYSRPPTPEPTYGTPLSNTDMEATIQQRFGQPASPAPPTSLADTANFAALAAALAAPIEAAGPSFATTLQETTFGQNRLDPRVSYAPYGMSSVAGELSTSGRDRPTVVMLQSQDRDHLIFPDPTACTLFLPRIYRNVNQFGIAQLNLTSAFFYFRADKENLKIRIQEKDTVQWPLILQPTFPGNNPPLPVTTTIREGSYNINTLLTELQTQLNVTPLFYDFLNGFADFYPLFVVNGDYSIIFNYPGDTYYDAVRKVFVPNPTRATIVGYYFQNQFANQFNYTVDQVRVAYYYPVLKEILLDPTTDLSGTPPTYQNYPLDLSYTDPSGMVWTPTDVSQYLIYNFSGINDPVALQMINQNTNIFDETQSVLDIYRLQHTFRYSLINRYICSYDPANNRVSIQSGSLNTSLVNLLNTQYNIFLAQQLNFYGLTAAQYNALSTKVTNELSVLQDMYEYLQAQFRKFFAVPYGTYSREYYANPPYTVLTRSGLDASGVASNYNPLQAANPISNDIFNSFSKDPPHWWPHLTGLGSNQLGPDINMGAPNDPFPASSNRVYSLANSNIQLFQSFVQADGQVYTDFRRRAGDILVNVEPLKYTIFQFKSRFRQTLQVESLPRQTYFRYPGWNKGAATTNSWDVRPLQFPLSNLFDASYCWVTPAPGSSNYTKLINDASFNTVFGWDSVRGTTSNLGITSFAASSNFWDVSYNSINVTNSNGKFYKFQIPRPYANTSNRVYRWDGFQVTIAAAGASASNGFASDLSGFVYHDLGAFAADVSGVRHELPIHYKYIINCFKGDLSGSVTFTTYHDQEYYILLRPSGLTPATTNFILCPFFTDPAFTTLSDSTNFNPLLPVNTNGLLNNCNVALVADSNFLHLPVTDKTQDPEDFTINQPLPVFAPFIGYDASNVSNDKTDYMPFAAYDASGVNPATLIGLDPTNNYLFQCNAPYNDDLLSYYYPTSNGNSNILLAPFGTETYIWQTVPAAKRQFKIVHWYSTHHIGDVYDPAGGVTSSYIQPYCPASLLSNDIPGYNTKILYNFTSNANTQVFEFGQGISGALFIPDAGVWQVDRITFKTSYTAPALDNVFDSNLNPNDGIQFVCVFLTSEIANVSKANVTPLQALAVLPFQRKTVYPNDVALNLGGDASLGTYYTFSNAPNLLARSYAPRIEGFSQNFEIYIGDVNNYYSFVTFNFNLTGTALSNQLTLLSNYASASNPPTPSELSNLFASASIAFIHNLTGSPTAYPYASNAPPIVNFASSNFPPTGLGYVTSTNPPLSNDPFGPGPLADYSMSRYEQSTPIVNSHLHYVDTANFINNTQAFKLFSNAPVVPTSLVATCSNYLLLQNGNFAIASYNTTDTFPPGPPPPDNRNLNYVASLTVQQIFPDSENTALIGTTGTTSNFVFLGASNLDAVSYQLRFKIYDPFLGTLTELPINPNYIFNKSFLLQGFVMFDLDGPYSGSWWVSAKGTIGVQPNSVALLGATSYTSNGPLLSNVDVTGLYDTTVLAATPESEIIFYSKYNSTAPVNPGFTTFTYYSLSPSDTIGYIGTPGAGYTITLETGSGLPNSYKQAAVTQAASETQFLLLNTDFAPYQFYKIRTFSASNTLLQSNALVNQSAQLLSNAVGLVTPTKIYGGHYGSKWLTIAEPPYILGNRNDAFDAPAALTTAYQVFFPTIKIQLTKLSNVQSPIVDLTNLVDSSGALALEYPHVMMFAYQGWSNLARDLYGPNPNPLSAGYGQWGLESSGNFIVSDVSFSGYGYNAYCLDFPLTSNYGTTNSNSDFFLAIRGYSPTESFQTMLRFYLPNRLDFGYITLQDLSGEAAYAVRSNLTQFNPNYYNTLTKFNSNFIFPTPGRSFGSNTLQGFLGSNIVATGFGNFLAQYVGIYKQFLLDSDILNKIQQAIGSNITIFITSNLKYIIPPSALSRQRFTDPILFQIQWKSQLTPNFVGLDDDWGLGWNLGYAKADTGFSTIHTASSFFKIQQDFVYLRLSPEYNINGMDAGGKESYQISREPTGITSQYYCKLLLTTFGGNATTFIHNPINFNPPLNRLTKLSFSWFDAKGVAITNRDAEWNMTVNLTEFIDIPLIPAKMPFQPADPKTGEPLPWPPSLQAPTAQEQGDAAAKREQEILEAEKQALRDAVLEREAQATLRTRQVL